jgi:peroxiredoxin
LSQFRDKAAEFEKAGAQILAISVDSFFSHQAFAKELDVKFPLLSDFNREAIPNYAGFYDLALGMLKGAGRRAVFVVDRAGTVRYKWVGPADDPGVLPDVNEVLKATQAIQ